MQRIRRLIAELAGAVIGWTVGWCFGWWLTGRAIAALERKHGRQH